MPGLPEHTRGYLHYLRINELTAKRLLTLHNLTFMERLMRGLPRRSRRAAYAPRPERVLSGSSAR